MSQSYLHPVSQPVALFEKFIAREPQTIVLKEKVLSLSGDSFEIKLENGVPLLKVNGAWLSISGRKKVEDMSGNHLFDLREEHMHIHTTYVMEGPNEDTICEVKSSHKCKRHLLRSKTLGHGKRSILVLCITNCHSHRF